MFRLILVLFFTSCQNISKIPPHTLRMSFLQDPATIDPRKSSDYASSTLVSLLFEGLTRCTGGVDVKMTIAEKVEISQDKKTYIFHLKKTVWSDGTPLTASDFKRSWKSLLTPGFPSPCAYLLYPIKNAEKFAKGLSDEIGVTVVDDYRLKVELEKPTPYFLSLTAFPLYFPHPSHAPVYNGPFLIEKIKVGEQIVLKRNPYYKDLVSLEKIHISILRDEMTAIELFKNGELDLLGGPLTPLTLDMIPENISYHLIPMAASTFCTINTHSIDKEKRLSLTAAVKNHAILNEEIQQMGQIPAEHLLPPTLRENFQDHPLSTQTDATFDEPLKLYYKNHPLEKKIAQTLQRIWRDSGIQVDIEQVEAKSLMKKLYHKHYQLSLASWIAQYHDPINILERFKEESNAKNFPGWSNDEFKELLANNEFEKGEHLLEQEAIIIPLYHWNSPLLVHPRVQGLSSTSTGGLILEQISLR